MRQINAHAMCQYCAKQFAYTSYITPSHTFIFLYNQRSQGLKILNKLLQVMKLYDVTQIIYSHVN